MERNRNVGRLDRAIRVAVGTLLVAIAIDAVIDERRLVATATAIAGLALLKNALTGYCIGNEVLGIDTCGEDVEAEPADG